MLKRYLDRSSLRSASKETYPNAIEAHLKDWLDTPLAVITTKIVRDCYKELEAHPSVANGVMRPLRAIWNFAVKNDNELPANPVTALDRYKERRRERVIKDDDLAQWWRAVGELKNTTARDYLQLLLLTGPRRGEAAMLEWDHVNFAGRKIRIPGANAKNGELHEIPMSSHVRGLLIARRVLQEGQWLFPADSRSGHISDVKFAIAEVTKRCGIGFSAHDLRRTFSSCAVEAGVHLVMIKKMLTTALRATLLPATLLLTSINCAGRRRRLPTGLRHCARSKSQSAKISPRLHRDPFSGIRVH
jgi:integrase